MTDRAPPSPDAPPPARRAGREVARAAAVRDATMRDGAMPRAETVRVTAPDLQRRAAMERTRTRLLYAAGGFALLFGAVAAKLAGATVLFPEHPRLPTRQVALPPPEATGADGETAPLPGEPEMRAQIEDRNGQILATSLPVAALYANPREMIDVDEAARRLKQVLPQLDEELARARLGSGKQFVYLARQITPRQELAINALGIPGVYFQKSWRRSYPLHRVAAQVLGGVDVDEKGVAGVEKAFDKRLRTDPTPLRLSIDVGVQAVVRDELSKAMDEFHAIGACGLVMDVRSGEVIALVSLPDYDANQFGRATPEERFNRAVTGMYEPGSTFKLQTAAVALDSGAAHLWNMFDAAHDIHIGRFTIQDFQGKHRWLYLPEVLAYSSNLGAAHIALTVGAERQRAWLKSMGMFSRIGIELPEAGRPIVPPASNWKEVTTMTVGFGHGIAVSPLHVVRGTAAIANGGIVLRPTILARPPEAEPEGTRVMAQGTSDTMRKLMRLVVTEGYGKPANIPGYFVGGKTGTAEKVGAHGYKKHTNVSAFMSVFPMNAPRYAVYFMLDEPKGNASTGGYSTAGAVSAPGAGKVIARIAPMLGLFPDTADIPTIDAALAVPLQPGRPPGAKADIDTPVAAHPARATHPPEAGVQHPPSAVRASLSPPWGTPGGEEQGREPSLVAAR